MEEIPAMKWTDVKEGLGEIWRSPFVKMTFSIILILTAFFIYQFLTLPPDNEFEELIEEVVEEVSEIDVDATSFSKE